MLGVVVAMLPEEDMVPFCMRPLICSTFAQDGRHILWRSHLLHPHDMNTSFDSVDQSYPCRKDGTRCNEATVTVPQFG